MRTCIDNRKRKVFNDIKHLSTKAVLLIIFLSLLPALQVMAMETPDETQQKSTIRVQGRVLDEFNQPLPGVSILAVKSTKGVITDIDGNYSIEVAPDEKLEFSYIGYQKNVVLVNGRKDIPIKMEPLTSELKEVTVVGYGTQRKASVIGAITGLPVGKINRSVNKLSNVLAGQMAGVVAVQRSGEPGEGSDFWIRGVSTFGANNRPLVLVDGIERDLNLVDPEDIETFSILKDATATAIYGVRGANGVVLITTRKGKEGSKPVISARAEFSILQPTKMPKMANAQEFMEMYNFAYADNKNGEEFYSPEAMAKYLNGSDPDLYPNINWMDEIYKNSTTSERVNINVTGGSEKVKYYVAGSYYKENGVFRPDKGLGYNPDKVDIKNRDLEVSLSTLGNDSIFYTLDGSLPDRNSYLYKGVLKIDSSVTLKAMAYRNNQMSQVSSLKVDCNKATFKPVTLHSELSRMHVYGGASMLVDGIIGSTRPDDARWLGFPKGFEAVIDLRQQTSISKLLFTNLSVISDNILDPDLISVFVSDDGKYYQCVKEERIIAKQGKEASVSQHQLDFESTKARFVKIQANASVSKASTLVPWMFVSEIGIQ